MEKIKQNQERCSICGSHHLIKINDCEYLCENCGYINIIQVVTSEESTLLRIAFQKLRMQDFYEAEDEFTDIIEKYPKCYEAYWGRLCSRYGLKYEEDFNGKKIPTCCFFTIESFSNDKDYLKTLEYAPQNKKAWYIKQSEYIERISKIWLEKASKERPYDIFICYKDSDKANGIERTQDSYEAFELYNDLEKQGYRVFYSRESLKDKVGEKYEPYIFNALQTAKVMIVYSKNAEYANSTWLKNEWQRFKMKIENGEKQKNSLIFVSNGVNLKELNKTLSSTQVIETSRNTWFINLLDCIKKIIDADAKYNQGIKQVNIEPKKPVKNSSVKNKEVKIYSFNENTEQEDNSTELDVAYDFLNDGDFKNSLNYFKEILKNYPNNTKAKLGILFCENKKNDSEFFSDIFILGKESEKMRKIIIKATESEALDLVINPIIRCLYNRSNIFDYSQNEYYAIHNIVNLLFDFKFNDKDYEKIRDLTLEYTINTCDYMTFDKIINLVDENDVDRHIDLRIRMQDSLFKERKFDLCKTCALSTLKIEEGNMKSLYNIFLCDIGDKSIVESMNKSKWIELEKVISYENENNYIIIDFINKIYHNEKKHNKTYVNVVKDALRRIQNDSVSIRKYATLFGDLLLQERKFDLAKSLYKISVNEAKTNQQFEYEKMMFCDYNVVNTDELLKQSRDFANNIYYRSALNSSKKNNDNDSYNKLKALIKEWISMQKDISKKRLREFKSFCLMSLKILLSIVMILIPIILSYIGYNHICKVDNTFTQRKVLIIIIVALWELISISIVIDFLRKEILFFRYSNNLFFVLLTLIIILFANFIANNPLFLCVVFPIPVIGIFIINSYLCYFKDEKNSYSYYLSDVKESLYAIFLTLYLLFVIVSPVIIGANLTSISGWWVFLYTLEMSACLIILFAIACIEYCWF